MKQIINNLILYFKTNIDNIIFYIKINYDSIILYIKINALIFSRYIFVLSVCFLLTYIEFNHQGINIFATGLKVLLLSRLEAPESLQEVFDFFVPAPNEFVLWMRENFPHMIGYDKLGRPYYEVDDKIIRRLLEMFTPEEIAELFVETDPKGYGAIQKSKVEVNIAINDTDDVLRNNMLDGVIIICVTICICGVIDYLFG